MINVSDVEKLSDKKMISMFKKLPDKIDSTINTDVCDEAAGPNSIFEASRSML